MTETYVITFYVMAGKRERFRILLDQGSTKCVTRRPSFELLSTLIRTIQTCSNCTLALTVTDV